MLDVAVSALRNPCPVSADAVAWAEIDDRRLLGRSVALSPAALAGLYGTFDRPRQTPAQQKSPDTSIEADARRWIGLVQSRDESALRRLHAAFERRVFLCAAAIVRRDEVAHEVVSATFMQAWNSAATYDPKRGPVIAWLLLIARSRSLDALRRSRARRQHEVSAEDDDPLPEAAGDIAHEPLPHLERQRREHQLQRAMLRLSPIQRQVLSMTTLDGLSQHEASIHLDLPLGTIKSHARRAMAALRIRCSAAGMAATD